MGSQFSSTCILVLTVPRLYGLEKDLGLHGNQYQVLVSVLFVTYITLELPSNLVVKKFGPSRWLSFIAFSWGMVATFSGFARNFGSMLACRLLLGAFEGGLFPGIVVYLTCFYTKRELALRISYLFTCSALAGACGGLLAYAIGFLDSELPCGLNAHLLTEIKTPADNVDGDGSCGSRVHLR